MLADNFAQIRKQISNAARTAGLDVYNVELIAVSKTQPVKFIQAAIDIGQRHFGENRVQEAASKFPALKAAYPDLKLHMIGQLQTNKVKAAVELFDAIHTVDSEKLADKIAGEMQKQSRTMTCFIEVNTGAEPQKPV